MGQVSTASQDQLEHGGPLRAAAKWRIAIAVAAFALSAILPPIVGITWVLLRRQDRWLLLAELALLLAAGVIFRSRSKPLADSLRVYLVAFVVMALAALAGHYWVLCGYDLSRDEQMATFDAMVFAGGHLAQPLPAMWRDHADALNTLFMYPAEHRAAWISAYLPMNSVLRTIAGLLGSQTIVGPMMTLAGGAALWGCARRIWPEDREAAVVASLLYVGSGQVLFAGMSAYAMPAHLALNLAWLWLYLGRTRIGDVLALAIGFVAIGLHQPIVHPMFAAPLLYLLVRDREWKRAGFFAVGYALAGAFWLWWPMWTWGLVQASVDAVPPAGVDFGTRLMVAMSKGNFLVLPEMTANLLRFFAWQHILLLPLLLAGVAVARKHALAGAIGGGLLLTVCVMAVILPNQGHGFGYRYLHALIGNAILLAVFGWKHLGEATARWRGLMVPTTALGLLIIAPMQAWMAYTQYAPFARIDARIAARSADYVVIGKEDVPYTGDLVINPPLLDRGPVRLLRESMDPALVEALCAGHATVDLIDVAWFRPIALYLGHRPDPKARANNDAMAKQLRDAGCRVSYLDGMEAFEHARRDG